jgi:hypothetical protein
VDGGAPASGAGACASPALVDLRRDIKPAPRTGTTDESCLATMNITIYGWSTDVERHVNVTICLVDGVISA